MPQVYKLARPEDAASLLQTARRCRDAPFLCRGRAAAPAASGCAPGGARRVLVPVLPHAAAPGVEATRVRRAGDAVGGHCVPEIRPLLPLSATGPSLPGCMYLGRVQTVGAGSGWGLGPASGTLRFPSAPPPVPALRIPSLRAWTCICKAAGSPVRSGLRRSGCSGARSRPSLTHRGMPAAFRTPSASSANPFSG